MWVNLYKAYDTLSDRMKEILADMGLSFGMNLAEAGQPVAEANGA